jgi:hypothetical protein
MQHVLAALPGSLRIVILLEKELLSQDLALLLHHFPP